MQNEYIGIDLGTANTRIYTTRHGIVLNEPSFVAYEKRSGRIIATGQEAKNMYEKTPSELVAVSPLKEGVISDFDFTVMMLRSFMRKVKRGILDARPKIIACIPCGVSEVEKKALEEVILETGAKSVSLVEEPIVAALGAELPVMESKGSIIVNIGGGTTEIAITANGGIVNYSSVKVCGATFDEALVAYIKKEFNVSVSRGTAEEVKMMVGSAHHTTDVGIVDIRGRNIATGLPAEINLYSRETREAYTDVVTSLIEAIRATIEATQPELCADIYDSGIVLSGGGAMLPGLDFSIAEATRQKVYVAKRPENCAIYGIAAIMEKEELHSLLDGDKFDTGINSAIIQ